MNRIDIEGGVILIAGMDECGRACDWLDEQEMRKVETFASQHRRTEWTLWRQMVRMELGRWQTIGYDISGAPVLIGRTSDAIAHVGVSHSRDHVAVVLNANRCAIDMENMERNFDRVSKRYVSPAEEKLFQGGDRRSFMAALWCAKEAAYKLAGREGTEFEKDIIVGSFDTSGGRMSAELYGERTIELNSFTFGYEMVCWCRDE